MAEETVLTEEDTDVSLLSKEEGDDKEVPQEEESVEETPAEGEEKEAKEEDSEDGEKSDKEKSDKVPDEYEDFTLPEGFEPHEELMEQAKPLFKELGLTQEQAQKLVDLQTQQAQKEAEATVEAWKSTMQDWVKQTKDDKEIGGANFNDNLATARKAIDEFASDDFKEMLNYTGVGNHPEMARFLVRVGKAISEDKILHGGKEASGSKDPAKVLYPNMN